MNELLEWYPTMYLDNPSSCNSRATTRDERDVQWERDYKHKKGIRYEGGNTSASTFAGSVSWR